MFSTTLKQMAERNTALEAHRKLLHLVQDFSRPMIWLFAGDSITHGIEHTHGARNYVELWQELIKWEWGIHTPTGYHHGERRRDFIINSGVSGQTAGDFLRDLPWRLHQFNPQVVFINFGINDAMHDDGIAPFTAHLTGIVNAVREKGAIPVLQTPTPTNFEKLTELPLYAEAVRALADREKLLLVDHAAYWKEILGSDQAYPDWMSDTVHPNAKGHRVMHRVLAVALDMVPPYSETVR